MIRVLLASILALSLTACGGEEPDSNIDTHQPRLGCTDGEQEKFLVVKVVDAAGEPVADATVTARNMGTGKTITATTSSNGVSTAVGSSIGSGTVQVSAKSGTTPTDLKQAEFVCGECGCTIHPSSLTLTVP